MGVLMEGHTPLMKQCEELNFNLTKPLEGGFSASALPTFWTR